MVHDFTNKVILQGRVGSQSKLFKTTCGDVNFYQIRFRLEIDDVFTSSDGRESKTETTYVYVVADSSSKPSAANSCIVGLREGDIVHIEGHIRDEIYTDKNGMTSYFIVVYASSIIKLS